MKKLLLLPFALLIMGILFFGCEKDQVQIEESYLDSTEMVSSERSIDCTPCLGANGCCCRLISLQGYDNPHSAQLCFINPIFEIPNPYGSFMDDSAAEPCTINATNCNQNPVSGFSYDIVFPNDLMPNPNADPNPYFPHGFFAGFCSARNNLFRVCNPHNFTIRMVFNCELDVEDAWKVFELEPMECMVFRIQGCVMTECE